jgi:YD repeat-containing protein
MVYVAFVIDAYARDPRGLVTRHTDPTGIDTSYAYDKAGEQVSVTGAPRTIWENGTSTVDVEPVTTLGRNTFGEVTHQRDPKLAVTTAGYDTMGRLTTLTRPTYTPPGGSPITSITTTTYNAQGRPATITDPLGNVTALAYDKYGRETSRTLSDPDGPGGPKTAPVWSYAYSKAGELLDITDPTGAHTLATYDELGRQVTLTRSERPSGTPVYYTTTIGYSDAGLPVTVTSPLSHTTTTDYNAAGEPTEVTDPTGRFTRTGYDLAGRVVSTVAGQGSAYADPVTTTAYDLAGRRTSESDCTATLAGACGTILRTHASTFDAAGRPTSTTSAEGRPTFYGYDDAGQLSSITQRVTPTVAGSAITIGLGYDKVGRRSRMVDGMGNATIYTYTSWGYPNPRSSPRPPPTPHWPTGPGPPCTTRPDARCRTGYPAQSPAPSPSTTWAARPAKPDRARKPPPRPGRSTTTPSAGSCRRAHRPVTTPTRGPTGGCWPPAPATAAVPASLTTPRRI